MAVEFNMIESTSTTANLPTDAAVTYNVGINSPGGPVEFLIVRGDFTFDADPALADMSNLLSTIRVNLNGEIVHDYRAGAAVATNNGPGRYAYLLNSIGGRAYELPAGTTTREFYWAIPLGRQLPTGVNRWEITMTWVAAADAIASGTLQFWMRTNTAMQQTTTVCPATSFTHAVALEQVVIRVPQNVPGVVSAIMVQNDSFANEYGSQGIRINALGAYGLEHSFWIWLNSDLANGIMYADNDLSITQQSYATELKGCMMLPVFGLSGGNVVAQVDSSAVTTRTYQPILTHAIGAKSSPEVRQTQAAPGNTAKTIVRRTED